MRRRQQVWKMKAARLQTRHRGAKWPISRSIFGNLAEFDFTGRENFIGAEGPKMRILAKIGRIWVQALGQPKIGLKKTQNVQKSLEKWPNFWPI